MLPHDNPETKIRKRKSPSSRNERKGKAQENIFDETPAEFQEGTTTIMEGVREASSVRRKQKSIKKGFSLALKFAFFISAVAASLCFIAELIVYFQTKEALLQEIDRKGASLVRAVGHLAEQYFLECEQVQKNLQTARSEGNEKEVSQTQAQRKALLERFSNYLQNLVSGGGQDATNEILNITFLVNAGNIQPLQAGHYKASEISGQEGMLRIQFSDGWQQTDIKVIEGKLRTEKGFFGVKAYRLAVAEGKIEAFVMLSAQEITDTTNAILMSIALTTFIAICLGVGISLFLASQVTKPVRQLMRDIQIVAEGNLDHKTIPTSGDEIGILAHTFDIMTQHLKVAHETEIENQAREHEMKVAKEIQSNLLPSQIPQIPGYDISAYYKSSKEVGGDYYDFLEIDENHLGFIVADVSGKSIPGSMVMTMTRALLRMEALRNLSPGKTFLGVNRILARDIMKGMFVTAMYGVLDLVSHVCVLSSAGHNPAILWKAKEKKNLLVNPKGMALGLDKGAIFEKTIHEERITLERGDRLVFYTDGVPEAMSPAKEEFGDERFLSIVAQEARQTSEQMITKLVDSLSQWKGSGPQSDDITIVTWRRV